MDPGQYLYALELPWNFLWASMRMAISDVDIDILALWEDCRQSSV